jgi:hypothetical protein
LGVEVNKSIPTILGVFSLLFAKNNPGSASSFEEGIIKKDIVYRYRFNFQVVYSQDKNDIMRLLGNIETYLTTFLSSKMYSTFKEIKYKFVLWGLSDIDGDKNFYNLNIEFETNRLFIPKELLEISSWLNSVFIEDMNNPFHIYPWDEFDMDAFIVGNVSLDKPTDLYFHEDYQNDPEHVVQEDWWEQGFLTEEETLMTGAPPLSPYSSYVTPDQYITIDLWRRRKFFQPNIGYITDLESPKLRVR